MDPILAALGILLGFALTFGLIAAIVAYQGSRRGYGFFVWLIAAMLGNPVFLLILLGVLPDRRRRRQRAEILDDIRRRAYHTPRKRPPPAARVDGSPNIQRSMGDAATVLPERSIGDAVTRLPDRGIGDEPTRGV